MTTHSTKTQTHVSDKRIPVLRKRSDGRVQVYYAVPDGVSHTGVVYQHLYGLPHETPEQRAFRRFPISREPASQRN